MHLICVGAHVRALELKEATMLTQEKTKDSGNTIQAMWVGLGSLVSFLFTIISAAILSRFLSKPEYGTYKQVMYVYQTLLAVFTLGLPKSFGYFLPRCKLEEGSNVVNKINFCFFVLGAAFSLLLYFGAPTIATLLKNEALTESLKIFSPTPLFILPTMGIQGIMSTYRKTHISALYLIGTRIFMLICVALPVAFINTSCNTALWGFTISAFLSCILSLYLKSIPFKHTTSTKSTLTYSEIFKFSIPLMAASIWAIAIKSADQFYISRWFGEEVFADFSNGSLELPFVQMVLSACGVVLLPLFSKYVSSGQGKEQIVDLWTRSSEKAAIIIYPAVIYCWAFAPLLMTWLYGDGYADSAIYFRIMLIVNIFTIAQYYPIIVAFGATKFYANVHMLTAILVWIAEYVCLTLYPSPYIVSVVSVFCNISKIYLMIRFISKKMSIPIMSLFPIKTITTLLATCGFAAFLVWIPCSVLCGNMNKTIQIIISLGLYIAIAFLSGKVFHIDYISIFRPIIKRKR